MELHGRYRLDRIIGVGTVAEVWCGDDLLLHRRVAVRLLRRDRAEERSTFLADGLTAARLSHRGAVAVYDVGVADLSGRGPAPFVVMEFAEGPALARRLDAGPVPWTEAVRIGADVAAVLRDAHGDWICHGHLEAAKILLTGVGAKVIGFGADMSNDFDAGTRDIRALGAILVRCLGSDARRRPPAGLVAFVDLLMHADGESLPTIADVAAVLRSFADATTELPAAVGPRTAAPAGRAAARECTRWTARTVVTAAGAIALLLVGAAALGQAGAAGLPWFGHPPEVATVPADSDPCADAAIDPRQCTPVAAPTGRAPTTVPRPRASTQTPRPAVSRSSSPSSATPSGSATASASPSRPASSSSPSAAPSASVSAAPSPSVPAVSAVPSGSTEASSSADAV